MLSSESMKKVWRGFGLAAAGAAFAYVEHLLSGGLLGPMGDLTVAALASTALNAVRKYFWPDK